MKVAALKASLALWKRRYAARVKLRAHARQALLEARDLDTHPRQALVDLKIRREQQTEEARKAIVSLEQQIASVDKGRVRRPFERVKMNVACQSSRNGTRPTLIVLHDTEGLLTLEALGHFFDQPAVVEASSNVGVAPDGASAQFVPDEKKAWAQMSFNSVALSIEQIGHADQTSWPEPQLRKVAQYLAYWSRRYGIPLAQSTTRGVCQHSDLGAAGGSHHDCGPDYPIDRVLAYAREYAVRGW